MPVKAATEHATECETRTATAEAALKVAQEERMSAVAELAALRDEADRAAMRHAEQMEEWRVKWEFDLNEAKTKAAKVRVCDACFIEVHKYVLQDCKLWCSGLVARRCLPLMVSAYMCCLNWWLCLLDVHVCNQHATCKRNPSPKNQELSICRGCKICSALS